jgi:hypothetical protein
MAEWVARGATADRGGGPGPVGPRRSRGRRGASGRAGEPGTAACAEACRLGRALGRALGRCYWLVDDARDLWEDFGRRRWNLFLLRAADCEPALVESHRDAFTDARLARLLADTGAARRELQPAVQRFAAALDGCPAPPERRAHAAGLVAVSLGRWLAE